jgi:hypothetical protein
VTDRNESNYSDPSGQIFATVGTAGAELRLFNGKAPYTVAQYDGFGFLNIDITNGETTLDAFIVDEGSIEDQYQLTK